MSAQAETKPLEESAPHLADARQASTLGASIAAYEAALNALPQQKTPDSEMQMLRVVIARDHLSRIVAHSEGLSVDEFNWLSGLDVRLKASAAQIEALAGEHTFSNWRDTYQPASSAWWWWLDESAAASEANAHPLLQLLSSLLIVATSISLTVEIARRFLATGVQFIGVFTAVSTALLTLLGGTAFTKAGGRGLERLMGRLRLRRRYLPAAKIGLALFLLAMVFAINRLLPAFAVYYNNRALEMQQNRVYAGAIDNYQLAINLNPDYPDPYYNLATTYEDVLDYAKAIDAYQRIEAVAPPGYFNLARAYNNLARLYILQHNYDGALSLLNVAASLNPQEPDIQYALAKNRGWSLLMLKLPGPAENNLRTAMKIDKTRPSAHCLLAQVLEGKGDANGAQAEWSDCIAYTTPERAGEVEAQWLSTATYRLEQQGTK